MTNGLHIIYDIAVLALWTLGTLGVGIFAFYSAIASWDRLGGWGMAGVVICGIVALSLALWGLTVTLNRISLMRAGLHYLDGKVGRKWVTTDDKGNPRQCYMRVEGRPFKLTRHVYQWLSEGDRVVVVFWDWARSQTVARVDKLYRPTLSQTLDERTERWD